MHSFLRAVTLAALLALAATASARRADQDFEFDDDAESGVTARALASGAHSRRPRRYVYDPHNSLCRSLVCKKREVCVLRDAFTALCATKKDILRRGDILVAASGGGGWEGEAQETAGAGDWERDDGDDDVFYDGGAREPEHEPEHEHELDADDAKRCVGCPGRTRAQFLCGSDNRTYSSLCRLDLHNCVRRGARPVRLACRGFCPCARARRRPRPHPRPGHADADWRRRKSESSHNEVLPERQSRRRLAQGSEGCALDKMANRLLDWFSVLMDEAGATAPPADGFPRDCKPEVRWMFAHLDTDGDGLLSPANLYALRHDERERCLRPFLSSRLVRLPAARGAALHGAGARAPGQRGRRRLRAGVRRARILPAAPVPRGAGRVLVRGRARTGAARLAHQGCARLPRREVFRGRRRRAGRRRGRRGRRQRRRRAALLAVPAGSRYATFYYSSSSFKIQKRFARRKPTTRKQLSRDRPKALLALFFTYGHVE